MTRIVFYVLRIFHLDYYAELLSNFCLKSDVVKSFISLFHRPHPHHRPRP